LIFPYQNLHVHGPTVVELPDGSLLAAWFEGSGERWADDVRIMGARRSKTKESWSTPFEMADVPGFPDINPMLFIDQDTRLWLMWYPVLANQWETSIPMYRISTDYEGEGAPIWDWQDIMFVKPGSPTERGIQPDDRFVRQVQSQFADYESYMEETLLPVFAQSEQEMFRQKWTEYKQEIDSLVKGKNMLRKGRMLMNGEILDTMLGYPIARRIGWQTKNKPYLDKDRIIVPLYSDGLNFSMFAYTDNKGKNWEYSNPILGGGGIQATIAKSENGDLVAYLRDNGPAPKVMQRTESKDRGATWTIPKDDILPNSGAGFDMITLPNGNWLIVYNHSSSSRNNLSVAISDDQGKSWRWKKDLENDLRKDVATRFHYPAVSLGSQGGIHIVYSYHRNDREQNHKSIKYMRITEDWVKAP